MSRFRPRALLTAAVVVPAALLCGCASGSTTGAASASSAATSAVSGPSSAPASAAAAGTGRTGCDLVTQSEASAAAGITLPAGRQLPYTPHKDVTAHSGCAYLTSHGSIGYDVNSYAANMPMAALQAAAEAKLMETGGKKMAVGGNPAFVTTFGPIQNVSFFKGRVVVAVTATSVKPGAALAVARLIAARM
jgi:hypothetical protein